MNDQLATWVPGPLLAGAFLTVIGLLWALVRYVAGQLSARLEAVEKAIVALDKTVALLAPAQSLTNMGERFTANMRAAEDGLSRRITELAEDVAIVKDRSERK